MNQKGHAFLIVLLVAAAIGGYLVYSGKINLNESQTVPSTTSPSQPKNQHINTTLGFILNLPEGWYIDDDRNGFINVECLKDDCRPAGTGYTVTLAKYWLDQNPFERQREESFSNYVKRLNQTANDQPEFKIINTHAILVKSRGGGAGSPTQILYLEDSEKAAYIIYASQATTEDDPNFQLIASSITNSPITTGDITGQMFSQVEKNNTFSNSGTLTNFPVTLYSEDKKTIVQTTKTDLAGAYNFRVKPGTYFINDPGTGWRSIVVSLDDIQIFNGGTIIHQ
ncbi:MAG: hypothetical protein Q8P92_04015 [Candidatus Daviesbacteria bacterium]|nr:hypothetical protein [Candidatus Daviesbacteria bacterium]